MLHLLSSTNAAEKHEKQACCHGNQDKNIAGVAQLQNFVKLAFPF